MAMLIELSVQRGLDDVERSIIRRLWVRGWDEGGKVRRRD